MLVKLKLKLQLKRI